MTPELGSYLCVLWPKRANNRHECHISLLFKQLLKSFYRISHIFLLWACFTAFQLIYWRRCLLESLTQRQRSEARMFLILFVALLGLGFACKPAKSYCIVINKVKELCGFYNYTTVDTLEQKHALQIVTHFVSLFTSQCSAFSRVLVCSHFVLFCFPPHNHLQPCRQLCQGVKSSSFHLFEKLGTPWPAALNCSTPPSSPNLCLSPSLQTTPVSLLPSRTSSIDLPSVFSLPSSHRHSSFSSINPIASISSTSALSSSTPTNSSSSTVHL